MQVKKTALADFTTLPWYKLHCPPAQVGSGWNSIPAPVLKIKILSLTQKRKERKRTFHTLVSTWDTSSLGELIGTRSVLNECNVSSGSECFSTLLVWQTTGFCFLRVPRVERGVLLFTSIVFCTPRHPSQPNQSTWSCFLYFWWCRLGVIEGEKSESCRFCNLRSVSLQAFSRSLPFRRTRAAETAEATPQSILAKCLGPVFRTGSQLPAFSKQRTAS